MPNAALEIVLITGMSGSGKSVALHALEDWGYYCVDNLPPELIVPFVQVEEKNGATRLAIAVDVRSANSLPQLPAQLAELAKAGVLVKRLFLDAATDVLVRRYSESRRMHPLSHGDAADQHHALVEAIELERKLLLDLRSNSHVIDTGMIRPSQLQSWVKDVIATRPMIPLTLVFASFSFKRGIPIDADYVFDVRMLPNPHYEPELRHLTGLDQPVAAFLTQHEDVKRMQSDIERFLAHWLGKLARNHRSYVTVAIGCTGGQHRSVYLVERLAAAFADQWQTLRRHREIEGSGAASVFKASVY
ncbi:MAG: RNase adapter RapZ [Burkholderiales bacterium]